MGDEDEDRRWRQTQNWLAKQRVDGGEKKKCEGKRKKEEKPERERKRKKERKNLMKEERNLIKYFFLTLSYSAQPYKAMHCSNEDKIFTFSSTTANLFFMCSGAKNNFLAF